MFLLLTGCAVISTNWADVTQYRLSRPRAWNLIYPSMVQMDYMRTQLLHVTRAYTLNRWSFHYSHCSWSELLQDIQLLKELGQRHFCHCDLRGYCGGFNQWVAKRAHLWVPYSSFVSVPYKSSRFHSWRSCSQAPSNDARTKCTVEKSHDWNETWGKENPRWRKTQCKS